MDPIMILGGLGVGALLWHLSKQRQQTGIPEPPPMPQDYFEPPPTEPVESGGGGFATGGGLVIRQPPQDPAPAATSEGSSIGSAASALTKRAPSITPVQGALVTALPAEQAAFAAWLGNHEVRDYSSGTAMIAAPQSVLDAFRAARGRVEALARTGKITSSTALNAALARWWFRVDPEGFAAWDRRVCPSVPGQRRTPDDAGVMSTIPRSFLPIRDQLSRGLAQARAFDALLAAEAQARYNVAMAAARTEAARRAAAAILSVLVPFTPAFFAAAFTRAPAVEVPKTATGTESFVTPDRLNPPASVLNQILGRNLNPAVIGPTAAQTITLPRTLKL